MKSNMNPNQEIIDTIELVLRPVESIGYAFLFGSATKRLLRESDIDILVGGDFSFDERLFLTAALSTRLKRNVDVVPVKEARSQLVVKAMSQGVLIFAKCREALKQDYFRNWRAYDDSTASRRMRIERIKRQYAHDNTPMVDKSVIASRIEAIEKHLNRIGVHAKKARQEFLSDVDAQDIVEYNLFQIVNHLIDMVQHVVVDEDMGFPDSAYDAVEVLREKDTLSDKESEALRRMLGFRNIVGHDYIALNKQVVFDILTNGPEDIKSILSTIARRFL